MNERWVCKRCYADNNETDVACSRCGLTRGADAPAEAGTAWQAGPTAAAQPGGGARGLLRFAWIPVVAIVAGVGWFASSGQRALEELAVGHCYNTADAAEISEVDRRDCDEPHQFEVVHVVNWPDADAAFPSEAQMIDFLATECLPAWEAYVGHPFQTSVLDIATLTPSRTSWEEADDREFICSVIDPAAFETTGSLRNAGR